MMAGIPPDADRFYRLAHYRAHTSQCLHNSDNQRTHAKAGAKA
jgi:hypothetical protein